ncbi:hypothetical protein JCM17823_01860 [Halorubrum gandharaense]
MNITRRAVLAGVGTAGAVGLAGCSDEDAPDHDVPNYDCSDTAAPDRSDEVPRSVIGDPDAGVTVAVFEDFGCPACRDYKLNHFPTVREEFVDTGEVRYEHWDLPIPTSEEWSFAVANAGRGVADREGSEAFFEYARVAYELDAAEGYSENGIGYAAEQAGDDPCLAMANAEMGTYDDLLQSDRQEGNARGVEGTPGIIVDGEHVSGYDADDVVAAIEAALE